MKGVHIIIMVLFTTMLSTPILMDNTEDEGDNSYDSTPTSEVAADSNDSEHDSSEYHSTERTEEEATIDDSEHDEKTSVAPTNVNDEEATNDVSEHNEKTSVAPKNVNDDAPKAKIDKKIVETIKKSKILPGKDYINATHRNIDGMIINMGATIDFINGTHVKIGKHILKINKAFPNFYNPNAKTNKSGVRKVKNSKQFRSVFNRSNGFINSTHRIVDGIVVNLNKTYNFTDETHLDVNGDEMDVYKVYPMFPRVKVSLKNAKDKNGKRLRAASQSLVQVTQTTQQLMMSWYKTNVYNYMCGYQCLCPYYGVGVIPMNLGLVPTYGLGYYGGSNGMAVQQQQQQKASYSSKKKITKTKYESSNNYNMPSYSDNNKYMPSYSYNSKVSQNSKKSYQHKYNKQFRSDITTERNDEEESVTESEPAVQNDADSVNESVRAERNDDEEVTVSEPVENNDEESQSDVSN